MWFQYSQWREQLKASARFEDLMRLFTQLLVQANGDVSQALTWLTHLDERYNIFPDEAGKRLGDFIDWLREQGYIDDRGGEVYKLTSKGNRRIRQDSLDRIFSSLRKAPGGQHSTPDSGRGIERQSETRPYRFGDAPSNIDFSASISNAIKRQGLEHLRLNEDDLEVYETEHLASCATVLAIDISHSMILYGEDRITPAKNVALGLAQLILTRYPKDKLHVLVFGDDAKEVSVEDIPFIEVGPFHTNTKAALDLSRTLLKRYRHVNRQIFMITDGKPSAIFEYGRLYKNPFGLDRKIVNKTLDEAVKCRRDKIAITTFMIARDPWLVDFVNTLTKTNRGRAYFSSLDKLGEFIFVDYIRNRRQTLR